MATIRKMRGKWQAVIRRKGIEPLSQCFHNRKDAEEWARHKECQADRRTLPRDVKQLDLITFADLIDRYIAEVLPHKKGGPIEKVVFNAFKRHRIAKLRLSDITPGHFSGYRDERLKQIQASTVHRQLGMLHHVFEIAMKEWDIPLATNPLAIVRKPKFNNRRERRIHDTEVQTLLDHAAVCRNPHISSVMLFALETAMRRSEILNVQWKHINFDRKTLLIPEAKNGHPRTIPLSPAAIRLLSDRLEKANTAHVFPISVVSFNMAWKRLNARSEIKDLHFHDFRHEAISRFFEKGLSIPEVALISGHKDYRMLFRYTHLRAEDIANKLHSPLAH